MSKNAKTATKDGHVFVQNRRATFEYEVLERYEAGIALMGSEVKSIRDGRVSLGEAYCQFQGPELFLYQAHVGEYTQAHDRNHLPLRPRKLLMHRRELDHLGEAVQQAGLTLIPLALIARSGRISSSWRCAAARRPSTSARPSRSASRSGRSTARSGSAREAGPRGPRGAAAGPWRRACPCGHVLAIGGT